MIRILLGLSRYFKSELNRMRYGTLRHFHFALDFRYLNEINEIEPQRVTLNNGKAHNLNLTDWQFTPALAQHVKPASDL